MSDNQKRIKINQKIIGKIMANNTNNECSKYQGEAVIKLIRYPHGSPTEEDCGCVECERIYIENQKRMNEYLDQCVVCGKPAKKIIESSKNAFCDQCTKKALDNAFKTLQVSLGINPETGKEDDEITPRQKRKAYEKLIGE